MVKYRVHRGLLLVLPVLWGCSTSAIRPRSCVTETPRVTASGAVFVATTTHITVYAETTEADASELAMLLEATSSALSVWFERPAPTQRVRWFKDQAAYLAGAAADGVTAQGSSGYYNSATKLANGFPASNRYSSESVAVHESVHQFHALTRTADSKLPDWYREAHADLLSDHEWDGKCVQLGVTPILSNLDYPSQVTSPLDIEGIIKGTKVATRADAWAIFRFLDSGDYHDGFRAYRNSVDAGGAVALFDRFLPPPAKIAGQFAAWLPTVQEPMTPIFRGWSPRGPHAVDVHSPERMTLAMLKASLPHFEAKFRTPASGPWRAGVVVSFGSTKRFSAVLHGRDGSVDIYMVGPPNGSVDLQMLGTPNAAGDASWLELHLGEAAVPTDGLDRFTVDFSAGNAKIVINGTTFHVPVTSARAGLAAENTTGTFVDILWQ